MDLILAIIIYLLVFIIIFSAFYYSLKIRGWSAFNLAVIFSLVILLCLMSPSKINKKTSPTLLLLYILIIAISIIILTTYILTMALFDFQQKQEKVTLSEFCASVAEVVDTHIEDCKEILPDQ